MESKLSPSLNRTDDAAWFVSAGTRQEAQEADACMASDDWLYEAPRIPSTVRPPLAKRPPGPFLPKQPAPVR
ncbi:hypothetical protein GCM10022409_47040 [Hymenobacter glaciei]|uniref:Uncharacterized protein n=1 Tax=Hymenobacter glaciei TaxID=877209 RepID=A0ABP7UWV1_9BACT